MWNSPTAGASGYPQPSGAGADPYAEVTYRPDQLQRMENEWRRLQRAFAYHPHVTLTPLRGDPPHAYQVDYRLTTVVVNPRTGQLEYVQNATVQILLPPGFPDQPPEVKPVTAVFHPNFSYDGLYLGNLWHPNETLLGLVRKIGEILAYRQYDQDYTVNPAALDWVAANYAVLPTDPQANLSPTAGDEPLARLCRYGPQSLESMKQSILANQSALYGQSAPDHATVKDYAHKTRLALNLFLERDVPEELQAKASELEHATRELVEMLPLYDYVRERRKRVTATRQAVRQLLAAKGPLAAEVDKLRGLVEVGEVDEPMVALKLIPDAGKLQPLQFSLPRLIADAEAKVKAIKSGLKSIDELPQPPLLPPDSLLGTRLTRELESGVAEMGVARKESADALASFEPVYTLAVSEGVALDFAARWREYLDMAAKAKSMERTVRDLGAAGLQAYFIENSGGRFGPFQFEQPIDLGSGELIVRSLGGKALEVRNPNTDQVLGTSQNGALVIALPGPKPPPGQEPEDGKPVTFPTKFSLSERCDDLVVLLEFLRRSTIETVQKFAAYDGTAESWAGKVCRVLSRPEVKKALEDELARAARRWRHTIIDLAGLAPWKERLATWHLTRRCAKQIPELVATINDRKTKFKASKKKTADILSRSGQDIETGRTIIPPKYANSYAEESRLQVEYAQTVKVSQELLKSLLAQLTARVRTPRLLGKGQLQPLRAVPPLPAELANLPVSDGRLGTTLAALEQLLNVELGGPPPEADPQPAEAHAEGAAEYPQDESAYAETGEAYAETGAAYAETGYATEEHAYAAEGDAYSSEGDAYAAQGEAYAAHGEAYAQEPAAYPPDVADVAPQTAVGGDGVPAGEEVVVLPADALVDESAPAPASGAAAPEIPAGSYAAEVTSDEWVIETEESADPHAAEGHDQTDIVFGFEPDPPGRK
jgi:ubiquitin-protein ligase